MHRIRTHLLIDQNIPVYSIDSLNVFAAAEDVDLMIICGDEEEKLRGSVGVHGHLFHAKCA